MNYAKINSMDIANGDGIRVSIFFSGCVHHCKNCFNKELWDFNYGKKFTNETTETVRQALSPRYIKGLSVLGGEPFNQDAGEFFEFIKEIKTSYPEKDIWVWTGYSFKDVEKADVLEYIDYIIDGRFIEEKKDLTLRFRGSSNQHIWHKVNGVWIKEE